MAENEGKRYAIPMHEYIDWDRVMAAKRYAGGHEEVMNVLFKDATVVAGYVQHDYQGDEAFAYRMQDGRYVIVTDSFGSCGGCDAWEDASDDNARSLVHEIASHARVFDSLTELCDWLDSDAPGTSDHYLVGVAKNLLPELCKMLKVDG